MNKNKLLLGLLFFILFLSTIFLGILSYKIRKKYDILVKINEGNIEDYYQLMKKYNNTLYDYNDLKEEFKNFDIKYDSLNNSYYFDKYFNCIELLYEEKNIHEDCQWDLIRATRDLDEQIILMEKLKLLWESI